MDVNRVLELVRSFFESRRGRCQPESLRGRPAARSGQSRAAGGSRLP